MRFLTIRDVLGKVYVADPNDTPHLVTVRSQTNDLFCSADNRPSTLVVNTLLIMDLDDHFTPPFHVEVQ